MQQIRRTFASQRRSRKAMRARPTKQGQRLRGITLTSLPPAQRGMPGQ